jgi:SAM-dependent MidA family methyltransferase
MVNARLKQLTTHLKQLAAQLPEGFLPFDVFMNAALYTPNLGYYTATRPVGSPASGADFITAPEISCLFGYTLAQAILPCFADDLPLNILECGAGTGQLAKDILDAFNHLNVTVKQYDIVELSSSLRIQQQALLINYPCVRWLDKLPQAFSGVVLANELLDALPVQAFILQAGVLYERGVSWDHNKHSWQWVKRPSQACITDQSEIINTLPIETRSQAYYEFEYGKQAYAWVNSVAACIERGVMILIDYGFAKDELYHPQRGGGTLMTHRLHQASTDILSHVGDADITAHVNFTQVAQAALNQGMNITGFVNQARFLINADIASVFMKATHSIQHNQIAMAQLSRGLQLLMSEAEMGELFKVLALTKQCVSPKGFEQGDRSHRLLN